MDTRIFKPIFKPIYGVSADPQSSGARFSPASFFKGTEQGAWYDPSDMSSLFQDSAATTPVTADGQPVGCMRDKSGRGMHMLQATAGSRPTFKDVAGLRYLLFDGVNDFMTVASFTFDNNDEVNVFAGIRKLSEAASGVVIETSVQSAANGACFGMFAPEGTNTIAFNNSGGAAVGLSSPATYPSPITVAATGIAKITTDTLLLRLNGVQVGSNGADQISTFYLTYPAFLGARAGTSQFLNGHLYGLIIRGKLGTAAEIDSAEKYIAQKSGLSI